MITRHPFESDQARIQHLYRLPLAYPTGRLLVMGQASQMLAVGWSSEVCNIGSTATLTAQLEKVEKACYAAIAIPAVLSAFENRVGAYNTPDFLAGLTKCLAPGGLIIGHMNHGLYLGALARPTEWVKFLAATIDSKRPNSPNRLNRLLQSAGLVDVECYYVQPSIESPMALIPCVRAVADAYFMQCISSTRNSHAAPAFWGRQLVMKLGLGGCLRNSIFFWGRRPC